MKRLIIWAFLAIFGALILIICFSGIFGWLWHGTGGINAYESMYDKSDKDVVLLWKNKYITYFDLAEG